MGQALETPRVEIACYGVTDIGRVRQNNEDHFVILALVNDELQVEQASIGLDLPRFRSGRARAKVLAVADGMGGHQSGERASAMVLETVARCLAERAPALRTDDEQELLGQLERVTRRANQMVRDAGRLEHQGPGGMGTTLTLALVRWPALLVSQVGDSRCYRSRHGRLEQLTRDQTVAQAMVELGSVTEEAARKSAVGHMLSSAITADPRGTFEPVFRRWDLAPDDQLLLCSDGLSGQLERETMLGVLAGGEDVRAKARWLVTAANRLGGVDNITALVADVAVLDQDGRRLSGPLRDEDRTERGVPLLER